MCRTENSPHTALFRAPSTKTKIILRQSVSVAGGPGFEPRLPGSEPGVLPLNYPPSATLGTQKARPWRSASACKAVLQHRPREKGRAIAFGFCQTGRGGGLGR